MTKDLNETVCFCNNVTVGDIKKAIENGATSFEAVQNVTQAGTGCGCCVDEVKALVEDFLKK